jgi:hypothetical protein
MTEQTAKIETTVKITGLISLGSVLQYSQHESTIPMRSFIIDDYDSKYP